MLALYERVAARANVGGLPVTAEGVKEIDQLLGEELFAMMKPASAAEIKNSHDASVTAREERNLG